jgi:sigma-B regulation protein RsbU (phosphoserine phosphatase)
MAVAMTVLRTLARQIGEPDEILRRLNDELVEQNPRSMFVTLQCLVFDLDRRVVSCANAGHHQLVVLSSNGAARFVCPSSGRPIGLMPHNPIERETIPLKPGDTFVLFSDGVSEAINPDEGFYGEDRLLQTLSAYGSATPKEIVRHVLADVRVFADGAKQSDDITVLAAKYAPSAS